MLKFQMGNKFMRKTLIAMMGFFVLTCFNSFNLVALATSYFEVPCASYSSSYYTSLTPSGTKLSFPGVGTYAIYNVNIDSTGIYQLKANTSSIYDSSMRIYVDNVQQCQSPLIKGLTYDAYYDNTIGSFILNAGQHEIKIYSAQAGFIMRYFTLNKISSAIHLPCASFSSSYNATLTPSGTKLSMPVNAYAIYDVTIDTAGVYEIKANTSAINDSTMNIEVDNVQQCQNTLIKGSTYDAYYDNIIGDIYLDVGQHTFKVYCSKGGFVLTGFRIQNISPYVSLYKDGNKISSIENGNISAKVDFWDYLIGKNVFVVFAVYSVENGVPQLYKVAHNNVNNVTKDSSWTGTIENITMESGKTYYAKVFVWDNDKMFGKAFGF